MTSVLGVRDRRGAYAALAVLTLIWGSNWVVMKLALEHAHPVVFNVERTWVAVIVLFGALVAQGKSLRPVGWWAIVVTGFLQTTVNFGSTTMALAGGGAGRTSVLVFTMPFWTLLIAWPVLHERVRGAQWMAIVAAFMGLVLVVGPWEWQGDLAPRLWAVASGLGWAAGTVATKYFQQRQRLDMLNFMAWQMAIGVLPLTLLPGFVDFAPTQWSAAQVYLLIHVGAVSTALGFLLWIAILRYLPAGTASLNMFAIPVIALVSSMLVFGERLSATEWLGIGCIGAGLAIISLQATRAPRETATPTPIDGG
jgi:drug/metabolite transporter (DMT)-like permease